MGRFEVKQKDSVGDILPLPTTHTVEIKDNATGEITKGSGGTVKEAEDRAWDNMSKKK